MVANTVMKVYPSGQHPAPIYAAMRGYGAILLGLILRQNHDAVGGKCKGGHLILYGYY